MDIIDGKKLAEQIKDEIAQEIINLGGTERPNLAIILVGDRPDSQLYVSLKEKQAKTVGIDTHLYKCPENITEEELLETINFLNKDDEVDAILVQMPLPKEIDSFKIIESIDPMKDADGFHSENLRKLDNLNGEALIIPPVFGAILEMLKSVGCSLIEKQVCIIANADIFEDNLARVLEQRGAKVELTKIEDEDLIDKTVKADIIITAVGQPKFLKQHMIKEKAMIIDVGIAKDENNKVCGDVDFEDVEDKASYVSPVPGGVGPMTIAMAFRNTLIAYNNRHK
ncbi:MAG: bifunctional 5,10-methylenetetrahydrofolate dehydrogenase/5,10-methenyltetrahydrofolate cyclohydrolase [bacterium]